VHKKVQAALESSGVSYRTQRHKDLPIEIRSPHDFARALGYDLERITKTLLLRSTERDEFAVAVLSINKRVQLEKIAELLQTKRVQLATREELSRILDYPPTGVSPIGAGALPVIIDAGIMEFPTVLVGAGEAAVEIEISPQALVQVTDAKVMPIVE
jgi:Cys-tRNA(Pro)/Cys-tRNA(Cys) deacylase